MVRSAPRLSAPEGTLTQEIKFTPPPPAEIRDPEDKPSFWEQLWQVPEDQWASDTEKGYKVYLFEGYGLKGPYLEKLTEPFDIDWVKRKYGGGEYSATLNAPGGKIESSARFSCFGESIRKSPQSVQAVPAVASTSDNFQSQVLEIMREGQRRQEEMLSRIMDRERPAMPAVATPSIDPNIMLRGVVDMFSGLLTKAQAPQPQMGLLEMVALIEKFKGPDLLTVLTQAKAAGLIPAAGSGGSLVTQFRELKEAAEVVGLGEGKGKSWAETLIEKGPEILEAGSKLIGNYKEVEDKRLASANAILQIQRNGRTIVTPPPAVQTQPEMQIHTTPPPIIPSGSTLEVESPTAAQTLTAEEVQARAQQQSDFIKNKVVEHIASGFTGEQIVEFLDSVDATICDRFSGRNAAEIGLWFAKDAILKKAVTLPRFNAAIEEMVEEINSGGDEDGPPAQVN